jgi:hypothetical protein
MGLVGLPDGHHKHARIREAWARFAYVIPLLLAIATICGCSRLSPDPQILDFAKQYVEAVRTRDFPTIERSISLALKNDKLRPAFEKISGMFPPGQPKSIDVVTWRWNAGPINDPAKRIDRYDLRLKYDYPDRPILIDFVATRQAGQIQVIGFHVVPLDKQALERNAFTLRDKPISSLGFLLYAVVLPLFMLCTAIICIRTPMVRWRWKWLWLIFIMLGFGKATLNWTTGDLVPGGVLSNTPAGSVTTSPVLSVTLFGSEYFSNPLGPILISSSLPLGALLFLLVHQRWVRARREEASGALQAPSDQV